MKKFIIVLQFELMNYLKNKSYMISTILLGIVLAALLFLPNVIDMSSMLGTGSTSDTTVNSPESINEEAKKEDSVKKDTMMYHDPNRVLGDLSILKLVYPDVEFLPANDLEHMKDSVTKEEVEAGFDIKSYTEFDYYVFNQSMYGHTSDRFKDVLNRLNRIRYCEANNLDYEELEAAYSAPVIVNEQILGKDTRANYWYCYMFVILVFMLIVMYGNMIAVAVTTEKSNRSIEVLVTSTSSNSLLFGKVIAGAIASLFQVVFILGSVLLSYQINRSAWGGLLDMMLNIPVTVLITFAFFGLGGFVFYAFLYGAMGALVSKTEDISKSSGGLMMLVMIVYFITLLQLGNPDGIAIKVLSFLPFSSYSAMFARVAMGTVAPWEIVLSFVILALSIIGAGMVGAKIYRMGTLRYGNPIKFKHVIKDLRSQK